MSPPSSGGKRGRDPEEDVYVDNLHSHKRYLSEVALARSLVNPSSSPRLCVRGISWFGVLGWVGVAAWLGFGAGMK
ncbi:hypothetical protein E2562_025310 [Oryza meyeriana var. granulata]|uniref:Uncharacterized protein n=1 Tax=Oryza meyeriana var. granulata TaxID=110450 RepID=A0A6G1EPC2_9ORYZ|nr:hypothetical protein E2562_025310 [Oryza meyeriana var. granulata]